MQNEHLEIAHIVEVEEIKTEKRFKDVFWSAVFGILVGIIPMLFIGLAVGLLPYGTAVRPEGDWAALVIYISLPYFLPVLIVFGIIAYSLRDPFFFFIPIFVWLFGYQLSGNDLFSFIANGIPVEGARLANLEYIAVVVFWYLFAYLVARPVFHLTRANKLVPESERRQTQIAYVIIFVVGVGSMMGLLAAGDDLRIAQQRDRAAVHVPDTSAMVGSAPELVNSSFQSYSLIYKEATNQKNGTYQVSEGVSATPLKNWWQTDTKQNCGDVLTYASHPGQRVKNEYSTTPEGVLYAKSTFTSNSSNPPEPENAYTVSYYCWVAGKHKYMIEVSDRDGLAFLEKYPIAATIDTIVKAPTYQTNCWKPNTSVQDERRPKYCNDTDVKSLKDIEQKANASYKVQRDDVIRAAEKALEEANRLPTTFTEVARLSVPGWGISFPLSAEIKDAYVAADVSDANKMYVGLKSYSSANCFAGVRYSSSGAISDIGHGVAYIMRSETADLLKLPAFKTKTPAEQGWVTIGKYSYSLGSNNGLKCLELPDNTKKLLGNIFEWAEKGIR